MEELEELMMDLEIRMDKAIESLQGNLSSVRTGRANASMFDRVMVDYYGEMTPINQMSTISIPEARQVIIRPYEKEHLKNAELPIQVTVSGIVRFVKFAQLSNAKLPILVTLSGI